MNPDSFEDKLRSQPVRKLPAEWRCEILACARNKVHGVSQVENRPAKPWLSSLREALWPSPAAWGALACLWIITLFLHVAVSERNHTQSEASAPSLLERRLAREQREFVAEEFGMSALPAIWSVGTPRQPSGGGSRTQRDTDAFGTPEQCAMSLAQKELA